MLTQAFGLADPAPLAISPLWGFGGGGTGAVATEGSHHVAQQHSQKRRADKATENRNAQEGEPGLEAPRDQAREGPRPSPASQRHDDREDHESDRVAGTLSPQFLCRYRSQEAGTGAVVGKCRRGTRLSRHCPN